MKKLLQEEHNYSHKNIIIAVDKILGDLSTFIDAVSSLI